MLDESSTPAENCDIRLRSAPGMESLRALRNRLIKNHLEAQSVNRLMKERNADSNLIDQCSRQKSCVVYWDGQKKRFVPELLTPLRH
jgi:hypothetical protein